MNSKNLGTAGEKIAEKYLRSKGYKVLAKNFKRRWGELDLVGSLPGHQEIIFFEVKTILKRESFYPEDEITPKKKRQLLKMAQIYLSARKIPFDTPCQIDILAIEVLPGSRFKKAKIRHYKNAIEDIY